MTFLEYYLNIYKEVGENETLISDKGFRHSYIQDYYSDLFTPLKNEKLTIVEIGIYKGQSMTLLRDWFVNSKIIGIENFNWPGVSEHEISKIDGITVIGGDAYCDETANKFEDDSIDIIIDDGSHNIKHQIQFIKLYYPKIKKGGVLIVEDVYDIDKDRHRFEELGMEHIIYDLRSNREYRNVYGYNDNVLVIFKK
jgi:hypothetical protein